jgi:hypothetical protein
MLDPTTAGVPILRLLALDLKVIPSRHPIKNKLKEVFFLWVIVFFIFMLIFRFANVEKYQVGTTLN